MVDALQFSYFLTVACTCFNNGSNLSFMLDGCGACARVTMVVGIGWETEGVAGGTHGGTRGGNIGGGAIC